MLFVEQVVVDWLEVEWNLLTSSDHFFRLALIYVHFLLNMVTFSHLEVFIHFFFFGFE